MFNKQHLNEEEKDRMGLACYVLYRPIGALDNHSSSSLPLSLNWSPQRRWRGGDRRGSNKGLEKSEELTSKDVTIKAS